MMQLKFALLQKKQFSLEYLKVKKRLNLKKFIKKKLKQYLVSCSIDNNIIIWNVKNRQAIYFIKDQICVDLLFESYIVFILQTQKSIIFYEINIDCNTLKIIKYFELEQSIDNQNLQYTMSLLGKNRFQYLVIKSRQNMVMKHLIYRGQIKVYNQFELSSDEIILLTKIF
ncbi:unnamed protein product [Paramecium sonneborni]|uniref:Uncharacterized protein n=1 Tax=Paramecium sonneborni TaxID=65129 RepID=A0A8S1RBT9_9CILI|nr:unnamed protein product [Paramecium sonneborni]